MRAVTLGAQRLVTGCPRLTNIPTAAAVITAVASQPSPFSHGPSVNWPMTFEREPSSMIITMIGTAVTPLMTALQNNALMGSSGVKFSAAPTRVATAIVP